MYGDLVGVLRGANSNNSNILKAIRAFEKIKIGRDPASDIFIDHRVVSMQHCYITSRVHVEGEDAIIVYLTDKSVNGTYINGKLVGYNKTVILFSGCILSFGSQHLNLLYIQAGNREIIDQSFHMTFRPGSLYYGDKNLSDRKITLKVTHQMIGCGKQASVYLAYDASSPRKQVACRVTKRDYFSTVNRETEILKNNRHMNVLCMIAQYEDSTDYRSLYSILPLYTGGTLRDLINEKDIYEGDGLFMFKQLLSGLAYIHNKEIIHCDVKPENILLAYPSRYPRLVISDFGLSMFRTEATKGWPANYGTLRDHAPESLRLEPFDEKVDCWSAGILLYWMLSECHPFYAGGRLNSEKYVSIVQNATVDLSKGGIINTSDEVKCMITKLLEKNRDARWSAQDCLNYTELWKRFPENAKAVEEMSHDFQYERYAWFDDEPKTQVDIDPCKNVRKLATHPDKDEQATAEIKHRRGTAVFNSLFKYSDHIVPDPIEHPELISIINQYRYPKLHENA